MDGEAPRVLVVDDDEGVLRIARKVLDRAGYRTEAALGGGEALRLGAAEDGAFDLLLTDVVMPGMTGPELARSFAERFPRVRVLFMSAYTDDELVLEGLDASAVAFIAKPFTVEGLCEKVRAVLAG